MIIYIINEQSLLKSSLSSLLKISKNILFDLFGQQKSETLMLNSDFCLLVHRNKLHASSANRNGYHGSHEYV